MTSIAQMFYPVKRACDRSLKWGILGFDTPARSAASHSTSGCFCAASPGRAGRVARSAEAAPVEYQFAKAVVEPQACAGSSIG